MAEKTWVEVRNAKFQRMKDRGWIPFEERRKKEIEEAFNRGKVIGYMRGYSDANQNKPREVTGEDILDAIGFPR